MTTISCFDSTTRLATDVPADLPNTSADFGADFGADFPAVPNSASAAVSPLEITKADLLAIKNGLMKKALAGNLRAVQLLLQLMRTPHFKHAENLDSYAQLLDQFVRPDIRRHHRSQTTEIGPEIGPAGRTNGDSEIGADSFVATQRTAAAATVETAKSDPKTETVAATPISLTPCIPSVRKNGTAFVGNLPSTRLLRPRRDLSAGSQNPHQHVMEKLVYFFGDGQIDEPADPVAILGNKGAGLMAMTRLGIPVPPGFTITTRACADYFAAGEEKLSDALTEQIDEHLRRLETASGRPFGTSGTPLLVSIRSGAPVSMPGMMDTVLNVGLNETTVEAMAHATGRPQLAWDCWRRLIEMFSNVVEGLPSTEFDAEAVALKQAAGVRAEIELGVTQLQALVGRYLAIYEAHTGHEFPRDPRHQLDTAIAAVFRSWNTPRAKAYRHQHRIADTLGTAANVQMMVFGNRDDRSGTGVGFTRNPATGANEILAEYLPDAQGEDVVAGVRTPLPLAALAKQMPEMHAQLVERMRALENHFGDMQDIEFTIESGRLWILQTRTGKRTIPAALRIAVDLVDDGRISPQTAVARIPANDLPQLFAPVFDADEVEKAVTRGRQIAQGIAAGPGAAAGRLVLSRDEAIREAGPNPQRRTPVILVRHETSADDVAGMFVSAGILTACGGQTSHAAVVARGEGIPCVVGCADLFIDEDAGTVTVAGRVLKAGDDISIDGTTGHVFLGLLPTRPSEIQRVIKGTAPLVQGGLWTYYERLMGWADEFRTMGVRANSDSPANARIARRFGAEGIGLCRTEHMFFGDDRIEAMHHAILADTDDARAVALGHLKPLQRADFLGMFAAMDGLPVTIRLLDPPLHEFLPADPEALAATATALGRSVESVLARVAELHEQNPMLGHRGCRLGITFPAIYDMQVEAIVEAACEAVKAGVVVRPEIMVPLVAHENELEWLRGRIKGIVARILAATDVPGAAELVIPIGTMIEIPRAAITADRIARHAEFFSFGTNDLTQCTYGISRDDAGHFMPDYLRRGVLPSDPFVSIDTDGVGWLVELATRLGRQTRPDLHVGICGEHGGEARSVEFCHRQGLDYVSCSPRRIPVAKLAAAQAALKSSPPVRQPS